MRKIKIMAMERAEREERGSRDVAYSSRNNFTNALLVLACS